MAFEAILARPDAKPQRWRRVMLTVSIGLHAVALSFGVVHSIWTVEEMPMPAMQVTLTEAPPPPPPPPPPAGKKKASTKPKTQVPTKTAEIVQPKEDQKEEPKAEEVEEEGGEEGGEPGGEVGGVAGGVVGGVIGGVVGSPVPPPPPAKPTAPKQVSVRLGHGQLAINPRVSPYCCAKIPKALERSGMQFVTRVRVCVSASGAVTSVGILRGSNPAIDSQIPGLLRRWRYKPLIENGQPTPFCYALQYEATVR